jgi:hypothetical protein
LIAACADAGSSGHISSRQEKAGKAELYKEKDAVKRKFSKFDSW